MDNVYDALRKENIYNTPYDAIKKQEAYSSPMDALINTARPEILPETAAAIALGNHIDDDKQRTQYMESLNNAIWVKEHLAPAASVLNIMQDPERELRLHGIEVPVLRKSNGELIWDSLVAGFKILQLGTIGAAQYVNDLFGGAVTGENIDYDRLAEDVQAQIADLKYAPYDKALLTQYAMTLAEVVPYTAVLFGANAISAAALAPISSTPAFFGMVNSIETTKALTALTTGSLYSDMISNGVDKNIALVTAPAMGVLISKLEQGFGFENMVSKTFVKDATYRVAASGVLQSIAKRIALGTVEETWTEVVQQLVEDGGKMFSEYLTAHPVKEPTTAKEVFNNALQAAITTAITAPILGIPAAVISTRADIKKSEKLASIAKTVNDKEAFAKIAEQVDDGDILNEEIPKEERKDYWDKIFDNAQKKKLEEFAKLQEDIIQGKAAIPETKQAFRDKSGVLYSTSEIIDETEEGQQAKIEYYNPDNDSIYYTVEYNLSKDGNVTITDVEYEDGYQYLFDEVLYDIAEKHNTTAQNINVEGSAILDPYIKKIYNAVKTEAKPESFKLSRFRTYLSDMGFNEYQKDISARFVTMLANASGKTVDQFLSPLAQVERGTLPEGQTGLIEAMKEGKYIIRLAQDADGGAVLHELTHFFRMTNADLFKGIEEEYGVVDGKWNADHEERLVNDFFSWLNERKETKNDNVFQRIANFIKDVIDIIRDAGNEKVRKFFDEKIAPYMTDELKTAPMITGQVYEPDYVKDAKIKPADMAEKYRTINSVKAKRYENGTWHKDPQLVAEFKKENGMTLSKVDKAVLDQVDMLAKADNVNPDSVILFMGDAQRRIYSRIGKNVDFDASNFESFDLWVENIKAYAKNNIINAQTLAWLKKRWDWVKQGGHELSEEMFTTFKDDIKKDENITAFLDRAVNNVQLLEKTPALYNMVLRYKASGEKLYSKLDIALTRKALIANKQLGMYQYGLVMGDDMMQQAAIDLIEAKSDIFKKKIVMNDRPPTYKELEKVINDTGDSELIKAFKDKTLTLDYIKEYIKNIKSKQEVSNADSRQLKSLYAVLKKINKLKAAILRKPSNTIDVYYRDMINLIRNAVKNGIKGQAINEIKGFSPLAFRANPDIFTNIVQTLESLPLGININTMDMTQLQSILDQRKMIETYGRLSKQLQQENFKIVIHKAEMMIYEDLKKLPEAKNIFKNIDLIASPFGWIMDRYLGTETKKILHDEYINNLAAAMQKANDRLKDVENFIREHKIGMDLQKQVVINDLIGLEKKEDAVYTISELLGAYYMVGESEDKVNVYQQKYFTYNNLVTREEKVALYEQLLKESTVDASKDAKEQLTMILDEAAKEKIEKIRNAYNQLPEDIKTVGKMLFEAINNEDDYLRMADAYHEMTGKEFGKKEYYYFPLKMIDPVENVKDNVVEMLKNTGMHSIWQAGFVYDRNTGINPLTSSAVRHDMFKVVKNAVWQQEYLANVGLYVRKVNRIFRGGDMYSRAIQEQIERILGENGFKQFQEYLDNISSPNDKVLKSAEDSFVGYVRSAYVVSTLAYRASIFLNQLLTSLAPVFGDAKTIDVLSVVLESIAKNPAKWVHEMEDKIGVLKSRQRSILEEVMDKDTRNKFIRAFQDFGYKGMEFSGSFPDRYITAVCWAAVNKTELKRTGDPVAAYNKANEHVLTSQPTSLAAFRSPLYQRMTGIKSAVLMFTYPLNVVWQQARHKIPLALRRKEYKVATGTLFGLIFVGLVQGLVQELRGRGPSDGGIKEHIKFILNNIPSSILGYVPLIGPNLEDLYMYATMGLNKGVKGSDYMPLVTDTFDIFTRAFNEKSDKEALAWKTAETVSRLLYLPVGAKKEYEHFYKVIVGEE